LGSKIRLYSFERYIVNKKNDWGRVGTEQVHFIFSFPFSKRPVDLETASQATLTSDETPDNPSQQKKTKNRCQVCSKRVGLTGCLFYI